ncbi:hypothetical protein PVIIG_03766 [Plasmodium vivax India VII]|uniref:Variable surface protein Vir35 n=1 Tax=Plasmodium vivax India VII TaxID=1077284 RepID=A0A0J9SG31_PLAVI|nr:hypothetical protein PVIIG_03766 [Plasmodium vivax India VII]
MAALSNYNIGKNISFTFSWKIFTFFFLVFSFLTYNDVNPLCKSLEIIYKHDSKWNTKFNRLLARHEKQRELERTKLSAKLSDRRPYTEKRNVSDNISVYSHVKRNESNNIDAYMKNFKRRYGKKKGLSKLDCYYENKVFRKINSICDIAEKMHYDNTNAKKIFLKKYGIGLISFALIPALGFIFRILFGFSRKFPGILGPCPDDHFTSSGSSTSHSNEAQYKDCTKKWVDEQHTLIENLECANMIFTIIMISIVILFFIYILIKVIKYEKIKAGKGRMNIKEYCRFCKGIL